MEKVSVIITTYNGTYRLRDAIESVLNQTYQNFEIIVVDDNDPNTEARTFTEKLMTQYLHIQNICYIQHEKNKNGSAARNTGLKVATGKYIAFLDDDDWYYPERLAICVELLEKNIEYNAVYTSVEVFRNENLVKLREATKSGVIWKELLLNEGLLGTGSNIFLRKVVVDEIGFFDEEFQRYQDVEYMLRFLERNKILAINKILVRKNVRSLRTNNIPEYNKYKLNKKLIFDKFSYMIEKLSEKEKISFYDQHYVALFNAAVFSCNKQLIKEAMKDYKYIKHKLTIRETLIAKLPKVYRVYMRIRIRT